MSSNNDKKYNEIMKNEEIIQQKTTTGIVIGVISGVVLLFLLYRYGVAKVKDKLTETITKVWNFIISVSERIKDMKPLHPTNQLTSLMVLIALTVGGFLIYTIVNMANNPYSDWNTHAMWPIVIFSVLVSIFFRIRYTNSKMFTGDDGTFGSQFKSILEIIKRNSKTAAVISSIILAIIIFALVTLSSDKAFVTSSSFIFGFILIGIMFVAYSLITNSEFYKKIKQFQPFHLIFNLIFIIPCIIVPIINTISQQIKTTPYFVYIVLLIEIAIIALYFLIPFTERRFYFSLSNKKTNSKDLNEILEMNRKEKERLTSSVFNLKKSLFKRSSRPNVKFMNAQGVNDTWEELFRLYSENESNEVVKNRLIELELCTNDPSTDCDEHIEYIKTTQKAIIELEQKIKTIKTEIAPEEDLGLAGEGDDYDIKEIKDGIVLKMAPVSLKTVTTPTTVENVNLFTNVANQPNYSYSLSFWIFMHAQLGSVKECNNVIDFDGRPQILYCPVYKKIPVNSVVKYMPPTTSGKPKAIDATVVKVTQLGNRTYIYDLQDVIKTDTDNKGKLIKYKNIHGSKIKYDYPYSVLKLKLGSDPKTSKEYIMPNLKMQKWNNIVVNFIDGTYDLFVNGTLVNSFQGVMEEFKYKSINIGENGGASGGIANIVYYKNYLTKHKILTNYNLLKNKNPPIISDLLKY
jgi:hypothetical protein